MSLTMNSTVKLCFSPFSFVDIGSIVWGHRRRGGDLMTGGESFIDVGVRREEITRYGQFRHS